jgi:hypothetical protein
MTNFRLIDYDHTRNGALCNGHLSNSGGTLEALWTYDQGAETITHTPLLTEATFTDLWDGINASVASRGVFWRYLVSDPTRPITPDTDHVIVAASEVDGMKRFVTIMVPIGINDLEFHRWLDTLAVPASGSAVAAA